ncbi:hypothetical protein [Streptomyces composti]|uniref:hypothetical protein n=1 Tax=Streptomyces composti TaxID=2720025 RepID=UPI001F0D2B95|nr:hypothetical protein [Streptomyces composti]
MTRRTSHDTATGWGNPPVAAPRPFRWKRLVLLLVALVTVAAVALGGLLYWLWDSSKVSTVGKAPFDNALAIPPLAEPTVEKDGTRVFDLRMQAGETEFRDGVRTPT